MALYRCASQLQDAQAGLQIATTAAKRWPEDPYFLEARAEMLLEQNQLRAARTAAERYRIYAPPDQQAKAAELLSRIALDSGAPDLLQKSAARNRDLRPEDPLPLLHLAEWQVGLPRTKQSLERALELYREAGEIAPRNAEALARYGLVLNDLGRPDEAASALLHALSVNPRALDGLPNMALIRIYAKAGRVPEREFEERWYRRLRALQTAWPPLLKVMRQPDRPLRDWKALGEAALARHDNWTALCAFTRCTRLASTDVASWRSLAEVHKRYGWFDEALEDMRTAARLDPDRRTWAHAPQSAGRQRVVAGGAP
jgi:tetratricopeptide (TPR) repeat protein